MMAPLSPADLLPLVMLSPVLVAVAYFDLRYLRIPNVLTLIGLGILLLALIIAPPQDLLARLVFAGSVFVVGFLAFALRLVGGGDVKILLPLLLAVPTSGLLVFANVFSAAMLLGIALVLAARRLPGAANMGWKSLATTRGFPMGLSIAMAGLGFPLVAATLSPLW